MTTKMVCTLYGPTTRVSLGGYDRQFTEPLNDAWLTSILWAYNGASAAIRDSARVWYPNVYQACLNLAREHGYDVHVVAGVVAATSANMRWSWNWDCTQTVIQAHAAHRGTCKWQSAQRLQVAQSIMNGAPIAPTLGVFKVGCFYANIMGDTERVTVDRQVIKQVAGQHANGVKDSAYFYVQRHVQHVAYSVGMTPRELQALLWIVQRKGKAD